MSEVGGYEKATLYARYVHKMTRELRYEWQRGLRSTARGVMTHAQARHGSSITLPPEANNPLALVREYRRSKQKLSPRRAVKKRMMREGNLSSRQWRIFRKRMNKMTREMTGGGHRQSTI